MNYIHLAPTTADLLLSYVLNRKELPAAQCAAPSASTVARPPASQLPEAVIESECQPEQLKGDT